VITQSWVASVSSAVEIVVPNGDFEDYTSIGDGTTGAGWASFPGAANDMIADALALNDEFWANPGSFGSGWQSNGTQPTNGKYGLQHPSDAQHARDGSHSLAGPANGNFVGFINLTEGDGVDASIGNVQSGVLGQLETGLYVASVAVGARQNASWEPIEYSISLVANPTDDGGLGTSGGDIVGTQSITLDFADTPPTPEWFDLTLVLDTTGHANLGDDIAIRIGAVNAGADPSVFTQANFDNVRLNLVPEPMSLVLFSVGMAGLFAVNRRRRG
jgi:hypothetical protein